MAGKRVSWHEAALPVLKVQWSGAYLISLSGDGTWTATRRDDGLVLTAPGSVELHEAIIADCTARGVPLSKRQAQRARQAHLHTSSPTEANGGVSQRKWQNATGGRCLAIEWTADL